MDWEESREVYREAKVSFLNLKNYPNSQNGSSDYSEAKLCSVFYNFENLRSVSILLVSDQKIWKKRLSKNDVDDLASKIDMSQKEYYECMEDLLSCWGPKNDSVTFSNGLFEWEKLYENGFVIPYGIFKFDLLEDSQFIGILISYLIDQNIRLSNDIDNLSNKAENLQEGLSELQQQAETLLSEKNDMESLLYSRFLLVLNEKKEIISRLSNSSD